MFYKHAVAKHTGLNIFYVLGTLQLIYFFHLYSAKKKRCAYEKKRVLVVSTCGLSVYCWFRCPQFTSFPGHPAYFLRLFHSSRSSDSEVESLIGGIFHKPVAAKPAPREHLTLEQDQRCQVKYAANSFFFVFWFIH